MRESHGQCVPQVARKKQDITATRPGLLGLFPCHFDNRRPSLVIFFSFSAVIGRAWHDSPPGQRGEAHHDKEFLESVGSWVCCRCSYCRVPSRTIIPKPWPRSAPERGDTKSESERAIDADPEISKQKADIESKSIVDLPAYAAHEEGVPGCVRYVRALLSDPDRAQEERWEIEATRSPRFGIKRAGLLTSIKSDLINIGVRPKQAIGDLSGAVPAVDHSQLSAQLARVGVASFGLMIGPLLVVEIAQDWGTARSSLRPAATLRR